MAKTATPSFFIEWSVISVPVKSKPAARNQKTELTIFHTGCNAPRKQLFLCTACDKPAMTDEDIVKAYKTEADRHVLLTPAEIDELASEKSKRLEVKAFVPFEEVDPVYLGPSFHLGPIDPSAGKGFTLLREAMRMTGRAALVQYAGAGRDKIGLIRPTPDALMLHELFYATEVNAFEGLKPAVTLSDSELDLAKQLVGSFEASFHDALEQHQDGFEVRLQALIAAREAGETAPVEVARPVAPVIDLMAALKQSLEARKAPAKAAAAAPKRTKKIA